MSISLTDASCSLLEVQIRRAQNPEGAPRRFQALLYCSGLQRPQHYGMPQLDWLAAEVATLFSCSVITPMVTSDWLKRVTHDTY